MDDISSITPLPRPVAARALRSIALLLAVATGSALLAACGSDGSSDAAAPGGETAAATGATEIEGLVRPEPLEVGDLELPEVAAEGTTPFRLTAAPNDLLFVAFGYTNCPDVCPTTLFDIRKARLELGDDADRIGVAFATVDPGRDTDRIVADYLGSFVDDGHPLRTPDRAQLQPVEERFGISSQVVEHPDGRTEVAHTARSFVLDDDGTVVVEWAFGTSWQVMANDLRLLLEAESA